MANELLEKKVISLKLAQRIAVRRVLKEFAVLIPELVKARTILGGGLTGSLPNLKPSTIRNRTRYSTNLSSDTSPSESNLTGTGQLLNAIQAKVTEGKIVVTVNTKKRKNELSGAKGKLTNNEVRKYAEDAGFNFFDLTTDERQELIDLAEKIIIDEIKKVFST